MPNITLIDSSSASIDASIFDESAIGKTPASVLHFVRSDIIGAMSQTLDQVQINMLSIGFDYEPSFPLEGGTARFTAGGGPTGEFDLYKPARTEKPNPLFAADQYGTDIEMGENYYMSLAFQLSVIGKGAADPGAFTLKLNSSVGGTAKLYMPFSRAGGSYPTLKTAVEKLLGSFCLPKSVESIAKLPVGSVFVYDTLGTVAFTSSLNLLTAVNPTVSPGASASYSPISFTAGPSLTLSGGFSLSGEFQIRVWKKSETLFQLGYYKKQGASVNVCFDAGASVDVTVGGFDVISELYGLLGDSGKLDASWLKANVPDSVAKDVQTAYKTAVQTKLSIAFDEECDASLTDQVAFSWSFDTSAMGAEAESAFSDAIRGDLSKLMIRDTSLPAGITKAGSVLDRLKDVKHAFTLNFLGLLDHANVRDSTLDLKSVVSDDGQLVLTDTAHLMRMSATAAPMVKSGQLRKVFAEDCVATIGYASSLGSFAPQLKVNYSYYDYKSRAQIADLKLFIETVSRFALPVPDSDWAASVDSSASSQRASLFATLGYDAPTSRGLFLDQNSIARSTDDFERAGRVATWTTPGLSLNPVFVKCLQDDAQWRHIRSDGMSAQGFYEILGVDLSSPAPWAQISFTWTSHIVSWASAMNSTANALQAVLEYIKQNPALDPLHDQTFLKRRQTFARQLQNAIQKAPLFNDALGLFTMYTATAPASKSFVIAYAGITKKYA